MSKRTVDQIITRVKTICVDLDSDLDAEVPEALRRAQQDAEDFWDFWPFLASAFSFEPTIGLASVDFFPTLMAIDPRLKDRWLRWMFDAPVYLQDNTGGSGDRETFIMSWSIGSGMPIGFDSARPGDYLKIEDERRRPTSGNLDVDTTLYNRPLYLIPREDSSLVTEVSGDVAGSLPRGFFIRPPPDHADYKINIPMMLREQSPESGIANYWTINMARYLENAAAATMLADNQDGRFAAYAAMADADLVKHRNSWKRRSVRWDYFVPRSDQNALRVSTRLGSIS